MIYLIGAGILILGIALYAVYALGRSKTETEFYENEAKRSARDKKVDSQPPLPNPMDGMHE